MKSVEDMSKEECRAILRGAQLAERKRVAAIMAAFDDGDEMAFDDADAPAEWID